MRFSSLLISIIAISLVSCTLDPKNKTDRRAELAKLSGPEITSIENNLKKQADAAMANNEFRRASQMYNQLADQHPEKLEYAISMADAARRAGDNETALKTINVVLTKKPDNADALEVKGLSLMATGEFAEAGKTLDKALRIDGKRWRSLNAVGIMFAIKQMHPQAIEYYNAALKANPGNAGVMNNLGLSLAMQNDFDGAIEQFTQAHNHVSQNSTEAERIDLNLALTYAMAGRLDEAERVATPHLTKAGLYNNMGFYSYISKNKELAKTYMNMALNQNPTYYERAWQNLNALNGENGSELNANDNSINVKKPVQKVIKVNLPPEEETKPAPVKAEAKAPATPAPDKDSKVTVPDAVAQPVAPLAVNPVPVTATPAPALQAPADAGSNFLVPPAAKPVDNNASTPAR